MLIITDIAFVFQPKIHIKKDRLFYKNRCFGCKEISHIVFKKYGKIKIYSRGKVVAKASCADGNTQKLIEWAKKCKIIVLDKR
jgi:hypothetical protein